MSETTGRRWMLGAVLWAASFPCAFCSPSIESRADQRIAAGQSGVALEPMRIQGGGTGGGADFTSSIRILLPAITGLAFDTSADFVTAAYTVAGGLAVSTTSPNVTFSTSTNANDTAIVALSSGNNGATDFTITGLKVTTTSGASSGIDQIAINTSGTSRATHATRWLQIGGVSVTSSDHQTFVSGASSTLAKDITFTTTAASQITDASDIRLTLPSGLTWDSAVGAISITQPSTGSISATPGSYSGATVTLNVMSDFGSGVTATVSGLKITGFSSAVQANAIEVGLTGSSAATAVDQRLKAVEGPSLTGNPDAISAGSSVAMPALTVTANANSTIGSSLHHIRLSIPYHLNQSGTGLFWDTSSGTGSSTANATGSAFTAGAVAASQTVDFEDAISGNLARTVKIALTGDFTTGQAATITGLKIKNNHSSDSLTPSFLLSVSGPGVVDTTARARSGGSVSGEVGGGGGGEFLWDAAQAPPHAKAGALALVLACLGLLTLRRRAS